MQIKCFRCEKEKDKEEFPFFVSMPDIRSGFCKECWDVHYEDDKHAIIKEN